jgi:Rieske Fe-S protein
MSDAWKEDFPVDWADDHYVTRREFTKSLVLVSCAAFAANGALVAMDRLTPNRTGPETPVPLGPDGGLPVGGSRVFLFDGEPCLLVRIAKAQFAAYSQKCTHLGCPVLYRAKEGDLQCPCHEGYFSLEDGRVLSGPPPRPLPRVELEMKEDGLWARRLVP